MRGGKRAGAGRKPGSPNKASAARQAAVKASGITPLDYMLKVMRNKRVDLATRLEAAGKAAPYVHPRLSSIVHKGDAKQPVVVAGMNAQTFEKIARKVASEV